MPQTLQTDTNIAMLHGNMLVIDVPVPAAKTVTSLVVQPRPMYQIEPSPVGEKADRTDRNQYGG